jgi:hypothetical protein
MFTVRSCAERERDDQRARTMRAAKRSAKRQRDRFAGSDAEVEE